MELEINNEAKIIFQRKLIWWLYIGKKLMDAPRESINFEIVEEISFFHFQIVDNIPI